MLRQPLIRSNSLQRTMQPDKVKNAELDIYWFSSVFESEKTEERYE